MSINQMKLDFWASNNYNVLMSGAHGVGKTEMIKATFSKFYGDKWKYFSASTMDPWVDLIGVPKEVYEGDRSYLDLVRPKEFQDDEIEAIFMDEFNRAPAKIKNAVMELIQFKSINGKKFNNLKVVWAAINPYDEDETYDVERMDPAQQDRFHIFVEIPYNVSQAYFSKKYGDEGITACKWWRSLSTENRKLISPRRLDIALDVYSKNGDVNDVIDKRINTQELVVQLSEGAFLDKLKELYKEQDDDKSREALMNANFYHGVSDAILKDQNYRKYFLGKIPKEKLAVLVTSKKTILNQVINELDYTDFEDALDPIIETSPDGIKKSTINGLKRWRKKWINDDRFERLDFLKSLGNKRAVSNYFSNTNSRDKMLGHLKDIIFKSEYNDGSYGEVIYGTLLELMSRTQTGNDLFDRMYKVLCNYMSYHNNKADKHELNFTKLSAPHRNMKGFDRMKSATIYDNMMTKLESLGFQYL